MPRILLDTSAMAGTATALRQIHGELDSLSLRAATDAAVLMPPAVAAQVAADVGAAAVGMRRVSARYAGAADDLDRRRSSALAAEGAGRGPSLWQRLLGIAGGAGDVKDVIDVLAYWRSRVPISQLTRRDGLLFKTKYNPLFRLGGKVLLPLGVISAGSVVWDEATDSRNGNWLGRYVATQGQVVTQVALFIPPVAVADFITFGALQADADAIFGIQARALSSAWDAGFEAGRHELAEHNYLGFGWHVGTAALGGGIRGGNEALNSWSDDVLDGKYTWGLQIFAKAENKVIDTAWSAGEKVGGAVSDAGETVSGWMKKIF